MTILRRKLNDVHTRRGKVKGFLWQQAPRRNVFYKFNADIPGHGSTAIHPPYVDIEGSFTLPTPAPPEVCDTLIQVSGHTILVSGYFDNRLERNPNLRRDFPLIHWPGEIAVLFIGKRKPFLTRGPPESDIHFAIAQYMGVCLAHAELGVPFPAYMKFSDGPEAEYECGYASEEV